MAKMILVLFATVLVGVIAEPPVDRQYLPPQDLSTEYGAPSSTALASSNALSTQYGVPSQFGRNGPSRQYSAPAFGRSGYRNGISSRFGAMRARSGLSTQYGVPSTSFRGGLSSNIPSAQYGAPTAFSNGLSTQYGAPSAYNSGPATQYGAPSSFNNGPATQYGAPAINRFSNGGLSTQYGVPDGGYNYGRGGIQEDPLAEPANYEFNYAVEDAESGSDFGHEERRQDENAQGQYRVLLPDGRLQIVDYEADQEGFKPSIRYEETGLGAQGYARGPANGGSTNGYARVGQGGPY